MKQKKQIKDMTRENILTANYNETSWPAITNNQLRYIQ